MRRSALGELEASACATLSVLLALLLTSVAGEEPVALEEGPEVAVELQKSAGDAVSDGTGLPALSAALDGDENVELLEELGGLEGLTEDHDRCGAVEVLIGGLSIDDDVSGAGAKSDARGGGLASACGAPFLIAHDYLMGRVREGEKRAQPS
jgi:hypothetical protein